MYRVQYLCPREAPFWQDYQEPVMLIFMQPAMFAHYKDAESTANSLLWKYHSARVVDPMGRVLYQV